jgi:hypothetical protein
MGDLLRGPGEVALAMVLFGLMVAAIAPPRSVGRPRLVRFAALLAAVVVVAAFRAWISWESD